MGEEPGPGKGGILGAQGIEVEQALEAFEGEFHLPAQAIECGDPIGGIVLAKVHERLVKLQEEARAQRADTAAREAARAAAEAEAEAAVQAVEEDGEVEVPPMPAATPSVPRRLADDLFQGGDFALVPTLARNVTELPKDRQRQAVLDVLHQPRFVDLAPAEVYATLLDEGRYLCSIRTMYRLLTATSTALLLASLGVGKSHSRPHQSNDNPFSESQFKTMKYHPTFPERFGSIQDARAFCLRFFQWYNHEHRHSAIGFVTPAQRHAGLDLALLPKRTALYENARRQNPHRVCPPYHP